MNTALYNCVLFYLEYIYIYIFEDELLLVIENIIVL